MNRKVAGLLACLVAALAVTAVASAVTSAATMTLPIFNPGTKGTTFEGNSATAKLETEGGASVTCAKSTDKGEEITSSLKDEGTGSLTFEECEEAGGADKCRSLGESTYGGIITATGTWSLVLKGTGANDVRFFRFILPPAGLHFECEKTVLLFLVLGQVLTKILQRTASTFSLIVNATSGHQEFTEYENDSGTIIGVSLKTGQEGGKEKLSAEVAKEALIDFSTAESLEQ